MLTVERGEKLIDFRFSIVKIGQDIKFCNVRLGNKRCSVLVSLLQELLSCVT